MASSNNDVVMTVKFYNVRPGFGKLKNEQFKDVFVHKSYIEDCGGQYTSDGEKLLVPNQQVRCNLIPNPKKPPDGLMAINVRLCSPENSQQLIEQDLRGEILYFDPARQSGTINSRHYGHVDFKAQDFNGPAHCLAEKPMVAFDLVRRQAVKMAVNIRALGEGAKTNVSVVEREVLGEVARLQKTYGFIKVGSNKSAFFHLSEVKGGEIVRVGQVVRFDLTPGTKGPGSFAAINISIVSGAVGRAVPKAPGSRAGSTASRGRRNAPRQKTDPPNCNPKWRASQGPILDTEEPEPNVTSHIPQKCGERPSRDFEVPEPDVPSHIPQRRIGERRSRDFEEPEPPLREQPKVEERDERTHRLLEEQRRMVARHSAAMNDRSKGGTVRPVRQQSPERPCRDTEGAEDAPPAAYVLPHLRRTNPMGHQDLKTVTGISSPLSAPFDPPARRNPRPVNPKTASAFSPTLGAARLDLLPSPVFRPRAPVLSKFRQAGGDSDSYSSSDNDVPLERPRRQSPSPPPPPPRNRVLNPSYVSERDPTRPNETRECRICDKVVTWPLKTPCEHLFCRTCIEKWLKFMPTCPLPSCQRDLTVGQLQAAP